MLICEKCQFQQSQVKYVVHQTLTALFRPTTSWLTSEIIAIKVIQTSLLLTYILPAPHMSLSQCACVCVCVWLISFDP